MKESKEEKINDSGVKKISKNDEGKVSGGSMEHCPLCYMLVSDDNMENHLRAVHGAK